MGKQRAFRQAYNVRLPDALRASRPNDISTVLSTFVQTQAPGNLLLQAGGRPQGNQPQQERTEMEAQTRTPAAAAQRRRCSHTAREVMSIVRGIEKRRR